MQRWGFKYLAVALLVSMFTLSAYGSGGGSTSGDEASDNNIGNGITTADTTAPTTTVSPAGGTYSSSQTVTLTADETSPFITRQTALRLLPAFSNMK